MGRSSDTATRDDVRRFQAHQTESGATASTINSSVSALRFLFTVTFDRPDLARRLVIIRNPRKASDVLSADEIARPLQAAFNIKYKTALGGAYGADLRASEVTHLKVDDIDSQRMLIRVEQGKPVLSLSKGGARIATRCCLRSSSIPSGSDGERERSAPSCYPTGVCFKVGPTPNRYRRGAISRERQISIAKPSSRPRRPRSRR
nr:site-specific integrase [Sphingomonas chungangi]